ncbi:M3 family metallopeptidase [Sandaracinobacter sp. RS1-74]|uniref:M3 family metallopeptidase n=1 Tax=Sandaracinobacteroides sayramensis TaxID=2913411 RepID=UPI001EDC1F27|nr:M3 family metallopeptidase [Sandaracinobacteroides sayramensis]MCG2840522.1 M3 family metallopeptidase [Sandaracinobacteroides sayramensis]
MRLSDSVSAAALAALLMMSSAPALAAPGQNAANAALAANPLVGDWTTPDGAPPYDRIKPEHYLPAFEEGMRLARQELNSIGRQRSAPTFENTIEAIERGSQLLNRTSLAFFTVAPSDGTPEIQKVEEEISPRLARFQSDTYLDPILFSRIDTLYKQREKLNLTPEQARLLEVTHMNFVRAGAALPEAGRKRLSAIDEQLAKLSFEFGKRVLADQKAGDTLLGADEMAGLPEAFKSAAAAKAAAGKPGQYLISATRSDFEPFLTLGSNRAAREKIFRAFDNRGDNGNANDTNALIREMVTLRLERAKLLGYKSHADYALENSMARTPDAAMALLNQVYGAGLRQAKIEEADLLKLAASDGVQTLEPWDWRFYSEKVRAERYAFDENQLKPYLPLEGILNGLKETNERLFGVKLVERKDIPTWTQGVRTFDVFEADGRRIGLFYGDWFGRDTKAPGAWMNEVRMQNGLTGATPQVANNTNYTPPAAGQPALISYDDAETMFHEFGHALHGLLSNTRYASLSGTNVYRDFVEFPSQVYEHWLSDRGILERHARNAKGEPMPTQLLDALNKARNFNQGYLTVQQLASAIVDMELHKLETIPADFDPQAFERDTLAKYGVPHAVGMRHRLSHFGHLFNGGYSAGYYAYTWAEVLEADAFAKWEEAGNIWDRSIADSYRKNILSVGNSRPPEESYLAFRGRMPTPDALLRNRGLK